MPITTDRWGNQLSYDLLERALASGSRRPFELAVRFFDCHGQYVTPAVWTPYSVAPGAIIPGHCSHHAKLDEVSDTLTLALFADLLPPDLASVYGPLQGWRVEVDLVWGPWPNHWPYFTGYITSPARGWTAKDGVAPGVITVDATGVLHERTRAVNLPAMTIPLATVLQPGQTYPYELPVLTGVCAWRTACFVSGGSAVGDVDFIPQAFVTLDFGALLVLSPNPDFSSPYATSLYAVNAQNSPFAPGSVTWNGGAGGPSAGTLVYAKFVTVEHFIVARSMVSANSNPTYFTVPVGNGAEYNSAGLVYGQTLPRNPWDNYQTTIAALPAANQITPVDSTGYNASTIVGGVEFVTVTKADGSEVTYGVSSVSGGVITLASNWAGIAVGDALRLSTTEAFPSWIEEGALSLGAVSRPTLPIEVYLLAVTYLAASITPSQTTITVGSAAGTPIGSTILIGSELMYVAGVSGTTLTVIRGIGDTVAAAATGSTSTLIHVAARRGQLQFNAQLGIAVPSGHHYAVTGVAEAWGLNAQLVAGPESGNTSNRIENVISNFLTGGAGASYWPSAMFAASDVVVDNTSGVWAKNFPIYATNALDFLKNLAKNALKPNTRIRDTSDGKVHIRSYVQTSAPDWVFPNASDIQEGALPDPVTAVAVISTDADPQNVAAKWLSRTYNIGSGGTIPAPATPNAQYAVDGQTTNVATQNQVGVPAYFFFDIPEISPIQLIPFIDSVQVYGKGFLTAYIQQATPGATPANSNSPAPPNYSAMIPGVNFLYMAGTTSPTTISSDQIARAMCSVLKGFTAGVPPTNYSITPSAAWWSNGVGPLQLVIRIDSDDSASLPPVAAEVSEIVINVKKQTGWLAGFSDNSILVPAAYEPADPLTQYGPTWVQSNPRRRESWRWAPTSWLERASAQYGPSDMTWTVMVAGGASYPTTGTAATINPVGTAVLVPIVSGGQVIEVKLAPGDTGRGPGSPIITISGGAGYGADAVAMLPPIPRLAVLEMQGISLSDCRSMAEAAADEYLHQSRTYTVTGPFCPWARIGDTVLVYAPNGKTFSDGSTSKMLMLTGIDDSLDGTARYTFMDYSA